MISVSITVMISYKDHDSFYRKKYFYRRENNIPISEAYAYENGLLYGKLFRYLQRKITSIFFLFCCANRLRSHVSCIPFFQKR